MEKKKKILRAGGGIFQLNQHSPKFEDKRTKRNRSRSEQKRKSIESQDE